jgi:hypothetical protein
MLEFIKTAYCVIIPILLIVSLIRFAGWNRYAINLISLSNILLIGYSFYLGWQLLAMYQLSRKFSDGGHSMQYFDMGILIRMGLIIVLPLLSLHPRIRRNRIYTLALLVLLCWVFPPFSWNVFAIGYKIPAYFCLMCSAYALLWLLNQLPHQSRP